MQKMTRERIVKQQLEGVKVGIKEFEMRWPNPANRCSRFFVNSIGIDNWLSFVDLSAGVVMFDNAPNLTSCREGNSVTLRP